MREERFHVTFPLFDPRNGKLAYEGTIFQKQFMGADFTGCCLKFGDSGSKMHLLTHTTNLNGHNSNQLHFGWSNVPSWLTYLERPYPLHPIWIGAAVVVTLGICDRWNDVQIGTGHKAVIESIGATKTEMYQVKFDNVTLHNPSPSGEPQHLVSRANGSFWPFQLSLCNPLETPGQDFYIWLCRVMKACIPEIGSDLEKKIVANWLDADDGGLMHTLYHRYYREEALKDRDVVCYVNGYTPEDVGICIWLIETSQSPSIVIEQMELLDL